MADDLTGACDSGVEFMSRWSSVVVLVEPETCPPAEAGEGIIVYNTQSRKLPPKEAYDRAFRATRRALSPSADLIFKKVDSALRGNFGIEIAAAMDAAEATVAFILPAIPQAGRETIGGVQHIGGVPIAKTFYARDPEHPVSESSVLHRAEEGSNRKAGLVSLDEVRSGRTAEAAVKLHHQGHDLIVVDAQSTRDLHIAVQSLLRVREPKVFAGCQGLARALAAQLPTREGTPCGLECSEGPLLCLCGTLHPRTRRQLEVAANSKEFLLFEVEVDHIADTSRANKALKELELACRGGLGKGRTVALCFCGEPGGLSAEFCESALRFLSDLSRRVVEHTPPAVLFLTGGETAFVVCRALGIHAVKLHARVAPLVVASKALGGPCHGMILVTKGGAIGPDDLICRIHESLRGRK